MQREEDTLDLDSALQELGMLAEPSALRLDYLAEADRVRVGRGTIASLYRVPCSATPDPNAPLLSSSAPSLGIAMPRYSVNSDFVTNITVTRWARKLSIWSQS